MMAQLLLVTCLSAFPVHTLFTSGRTALLSNNQSTPATTTIYVKVKAGNSVTLYWGDGASVVLTADGASHVYTHGYSAGTYTISVGGDIVGITEWRSYNQSFLSGNVGRFSALTSLTLLYLYTTSVSGNVSAISGLTSLSTLHLYNTSVSGNVSAMTGLTSLVYLNLSSTSVSGNISALSALTSLAYLYLGSTSVSGSISAMSGLTNLVHLHLYSTSVSGDIVNLTGLTSLVYLFISTTAISGDIGDLSVLTSLGYLYLYSTSLSYGSVALPPWAGTNIQLQSAGLDSTEVDNFLIDLASGVGANGSLNIAGTNAARTSASDAAKAALLSAGWSVTVNE